MENTDKEKLIIAKTQLALIQAYYNKIVLNKWTIEDVLANLEADMDYLAGEFAIIQTENIIK